MARSVPGSENIIRRKSMAVAVLKNSVMTADRVEGFALGSTHQLRRRIDTRTGLCPAFEKIVTYRHRNIQEPATRNTAVMAAIAIIEGATCMSVAPSVIIARAASIIWVKGNASASFFTQG